MKIILDKQTLILMSLGLILMTLLLTCIIQGGIIKQQNKTIQAYQQATKDFSQYCDINFDEFVHQEQQKIIQQQLTQQEFELNIKQAFNETQKYT